MPITVKALTITERKSLKLSILEFPEPELGPDELLIENVVVAQNPADWKQIAFDWLAEIPFTNGADIAGTIVKVGDHVKGFSIGERVISFVSHKTARHGGYQTHSISTADRTVKLPPQYSFEAGATVPVGFFTAAAVLIVTLGISIPVFPAPPTGVPLLVWGGSSCVGAFAIQLAKLAGYKVLATASPANFDYVSSLGATQVFDYHSEDVVAQIRASTGSNLSLVFDAISSESTLRTSAESITAPHGIVACIVGTPPESHIPHVELVRAGFWFAFEQPAVGAQLRTVLQALLDRGELITNPVKVMPGGLNGVEEGLQLSRNNAVSAQKLVYRIADTKF